MRRLLSSAFFVATLILTALPSIAQSDAETRVLDYIRAHLRPGEPLQVTELYNKVFTTPEEHQALDKLYSAFLRIPLFVAQYQEKFGSPPGLKVVSEQFDLRTPQAADVLLSVMESDPRVPRFITRDPNTREITHVDVERIRNNSQFGQALPNSVSVHPTGRFAYVANRGGSVSAYSINGNTGALTPVEGSPFPAGTASVSVTVDPTGQFAYVANFVCPGCPGNVSAYTINGTTGALAPVAGSPFPAGTAPISVTVDPTGRFAYVANGSPSSPAGNVSAYSIGTTGALTRVTGSPFPAGSGPYSVTVDSTGQFAYVANVTSVNVSAYSINGATGALAPVAGSPFPTGGGGSVSVTVHPTGRFAYVANGGSNNVSAYSINGTTGALTPVVGSPFPADGSKPDSVRVHPTGRFAYVANRDGGVSAYSINRTTGALAPVAGSPFPAGSFPASVTVDPTGQFAYVANLGSNNVSAYSINGTTGALTPVTGSPFPSRRDRVLTR